MYKGVMDEARCGVTSQLVNGCAAHASRRLLTCHLIYQLVRQPQCHLKEDIPMSFKFVTSDAQSNIYTVTDTGDLLYYRDEARNGTSQRSYGGAGQKIGEGWGDFLHVFSGGDGIIYAIASNGDLLYYRDEARNGTSQWSYGGVGQKIGEGWAFFPEVFSGGGGVIYAIPADGFLLFYKDE